ncbi:unnamed protein product [marine sediment metagenome]|uniref:Transcriptional coactivator p15 (PC4) C-terminal domain-containing protein n=1 Tax=marine sediment metagenome TaxID=412755 RepID=X1RXY3_9ZZZZ
MKILDEFEITDSKKLVLSTGEYRGSERVDLRQYIKVKDKDEYVPTKRGVNFDMEWLDHFIKMVNKLKDI